MNPLLVSALVAAALPSLPLPGSQDETPDPRELAKEGWQIVDGVICQTGDRVITWSAVQRRIDAMDPAPTSPEELLRARDHELGGLRLWSLMSQAGEDMGVDPAQIRSIVGREQERRRQAEGVIGLSNEARDRGIDPRESAGDTVEYLYRVLWQNERLGEMVMGRRPFRDVYVRPGTLRALYWLQENEAKRKWGTPDQVRLQILAVQAAAVGGPEQAESFAEELRERARAGEDFGELVTLFGAKMRETQGLVPDWLEPARLLDERLREFGLGAEVGDVSEIFPWREEDELVGYEFFRLHERQDGDPPPPFAHREVQNWLRQRYNREWERTLLLGIDGPALDAGAYQWAHPLLQPEAPAPETPREP